MTSALIAGAGYTGAEVAALLVRTGHEVFGLRRHPSSLPAGVIPILGDLLAPNTLHELPHQPRWLLYAVGADARDEHAYLDTYVKGLGNLCARLDCSKIERAIFISSTSVYAQNDGESVDETSAARPDEFPGKILLQAELAFRSYFSHGVVLRAGGIYGPGRTRLVHEVKAGRARYSEHAPLYSNRIHRDDLARAIAYLFSYPSPAPLYLAVDDDPADRQVLLTWLANRVQGPPPQPGEHPAQRGSGKRCSNRLLKATGFRFVYPTFREGYAALLQEPQQR